MACSAQQPLQIVIHSLLGDNTILCCVVMARDRVAIVVNERYSDALEHAQRHLRQADTTVWICSPDCPG